LTNFESNYIDRKAYLHIV